MREEPQPKRGIGFMNLLFLVVIGWFGYNAYQLGYLDKLLDTIDGGHSFYNIEETTCTDLKDDAVGETISNDTDTYEIMGVRNFQEISRTEKELVCMGEMVSQGTFTQLSITLADYDGNLIVQYQAY
jgi:hypothetical protein